MPTFRLLIDCERCKGCRLCVEACPAGVLAMSGELNGKGFPCVRVVKAESCTGCRSCTVICPDAAIEMERE